MNSELLNASAAARRLGVTRQRIYELAHAGRIGQRIAGYWVFTVEELNAYDRSRRQRPRERPKRSSAIATEIVLPDVQRVSDYINAALAFAIVQRHPDGGYIGEALDFPGLAVRGGSREQCAQELRRLIEGTVIVALRKRQPLPQINGISLG